VSGRRNQPIAVSVGAHNALAVRLQAVLAWLPKAAQFPEADIEHVHQLRVSTRKAAAALKLFRDLLPKKRTRRLKAMLKAIRNAAGDARDLDVLIARLDARAKRKPSLMPLVEHLRARREAAQPALLEVWPEPDLHDAAIAWLAPIVKAWLSKAPPQDRRVSVERLHRFRIATKQLRYALDLMAAAWPADDLAKVMKPVRSLQERLGNLNDHDTALRHYQTWLAECPSKSGNADDAELAKLIEAQIALEKKRLGRSVERFHQWWSDERRDRLYRRLQKLLEQA
jgi:CHAD domain-containing protein